MLLFTPDEQARFGAWPIDTLLEKHELYIRWNDLLADADGTSVLTVSGQRVLTPLNPTTLEQFEVVLAALDPVAELATVFLARPLDGKRSGQQWGEGLMLIARKVPELALYVTVV